MAGWTPASRPETTRTPCARIRASWSARTRSISSGVTPEALEQRPERGRHRVQRRHQRRIPAHRRVDGDVAVDDPVEEVVRGAHPVGGECGEVLQPVHPGLDGALDGDQRVRVREHRQPGVVGDLGELAQLVDGELRAQLVRAGGQEAAGRHHLDDVNAVLDPLDDRRTDAARPHERPAEEVAVPVRHRDRRPCRDDAGRALAEPHRGGRACGTPLSPRSRTVVPAGRDLEGQRGARSPRPRPGVHRRRTLETTQGAVRNQVHVRVEQPGEEGPGLSRAPARRPAGRPARGSAATIRVATTSTVAPPGEELLPVEGAQARADRPHGPSVPRPVRGSESGSASSTGAVGFVADRCPDVLLGTPDSP